MTLAVVAAMPSELAPLTRALGLRREKRGDVTVRAGTLGRRPVVGAVVGIGPDAAGRATERLLDAVDVELLVMIGICGGLDPDRAIGALVVPELVLDADTGTSVVPGPLPGLAAAGRMVTCRELIMDPARHAAWRAEGVVALDMETAAVGAACADRGIEWSVVRAVSDRPADGLVDAGILDLTRPDGSPNLPAVVRRLVTRPRSIPTLVRLGRDSATASKASALAAVAALDR